MTGRFIGAGVLACLAIAASAESGQSRYETVDRGDVSGAPGLRIITIRDNALKSCFAVFMAETTDSAAASSAYVDVTELHNAVTARDQRLAELLAAYEQDRGAIPGTLAPNPFRYEWQANTAQVNFALASLNNMFMRLEQDLLRAPRMAMTVVPQACLPPERAQRQSR
jgi:hypothetical protein